MIWRRKKMKTDSKKFDRVKFVAKVAVLAAISMLISKLEVPLWFAPEFYKLDFSAVFVLLGSFSLGPLAGIVIVVVKNLLKVFIFGTATSFVGELADIVVLVLLCVPAALIYKRRKSIKTALIGMGVGIICMTVGACVFNYFVLIPFYAKLFGMNVDVIVGMGSAINSHVTSLRSLIMLMTAPFNLFKGAACSIVTFLLYKRVSKILHI